MKDLKYFLSEFINRSGLHILSSTIIARALSFFTSWIVLQFIPNFELGLVIYAINIVSLIIPLSGLGASQGLLRFGALLKTDDEKNKLFYYIIKKGSAFSILLIICTILFSSVLSRNLLLSKPYIIAVSFSIFTLFLLESLKVQFRVLQKNKLFAKTEVSYNLIFFFFTVSSSYFFKEIGYVISIIIVPLITFLIFIPKSKRSNFINANFKKPNFSFWKYSIFAGLSNVTTQLLIVLDIILIGNIMHDAEMVTIYKYLSLIPFSILFLPKSVLTTDFVNLTEKHANKDYMQKYIRSYIYIFSFISIIVVLFSFAFSSFILNFFGEEFLEYQLTFKILIIGITGILILRGLFGNLLSVIGKASVNYWISFLAILINLVSNFILIPKYGLLGAAITSAIIMWVTSISSIALFYFYYRDIK
jgi:O-antigen/teichoic acid export membrane protein